MNTTFNFSTVNKYNAISDELKKSRFILIDYVIQKKKTISFSKAIELVGQNNLKELIAKDIIHTNINNDIVSLYPVATAETMHRVKLEDGRQFYTMCAIDSLGCSSTFNQDCEIFSICKDTNESVYIKISEQKIIKATPTTDLYVNYFDGVVSGSCENCCIIDFFQVKDNALDLLKQYTENDNMYLWTLNNGFIAANMIFGNYMNDNEIVCYCSFVTKKQIQQAIANGAKTLDDIRNMTKACTIGRCMELSPRKCCCSAEINKLLDSKL